MKLIAGLLVVALATGCATSGVAVKATPEPSDTTGSIKIDPKVERAVADVVGGIFLAGLWFLFHFPFLVITP